MTGAIDALPGPARTTALNRQGASPNMLAMGDSFTCPPCEARYPIMPVLIGRTVRCSACKNPFRLRADGTAEAVMASQMATSLQPAQSEVSTPAASPIASGPDRKALAQSREDLRRVMSSTLQAAAAVALEAEKTKKSETARTNKSSATHRRGEGGKGDIKPAILTGEGEHEGRRRQRSLLLVGAVALALFGAWFIVGDDGQMDGLRNYATARPGEKDDASRIAGLRARAWLLDERQPVIANLNRAQVGPTTRHDLAAAKGWIDGNLRQRDWWPERRVWVSPEDRARLETAAATRKPRGPEKDAGVTLLDEAAVQAGLRGAGISEEATAILIALLHGRTDPAGGNWIRTRILAGSLPSALEVCRFAGDDGILLQERQSSLTGITYRGRLLRLVGWGGTEAGKDLRGWNVFDVELLDADRR